MYHANPVLPLRYEQMGPMLRIFQSNKTETLLAELTEALVHKPAGMPVLIEE